MDFVHVVKLKRKKIQEEQQLFKKKNGIVRLAAYDLFKQNTNISRSVSANSIVDTRSNKLTRYFLLSFTYSLSKTGLNSAGNSGAMRVMAR